MKKEEIKKYAELLISMSSDYLQGGIDDGTFTANLEIIAKQVKDDK